MKKKTSFGSNFGIFGPNLDQKKFFGGFFLYQILDFVGNDHCMDEKPHFGPELVPLNPNSDRQLFFQKSDVFSH